jgi:hypothetical protein
MSLQEWQMPAKEAALGGRVGFVVTTRSGDSALRLHPDVIRADLNKRVAGIEVSAPDAGRQLWRAFLAHAAVPLISEPSRRWDMDISVLSVQTPPDALHFKVAILERRIGLQEPDWGYAGAIISALRLTVRAADSGWRDIPSEVAIGDYDVGEMPEGLDAFRRDVEAS